MFPFNVIAQHLTLFLTISTYYTHTHERTHTGSPLDNAVCCYFIVVNLKALSRQQRIFPNFLLKSCERTSDVCVCVCMCGNGKWFAYEIRQFVGVALMLRKPRQLLDQPLHGQRRVFLAYEPAAGDPTDQLRQPEVTGAQSATSVCNWQLAFAVTLGSSSDSI